MRCVSGLPVVRILSLFRMIGRLYERLPSDLPITASVEKRGQQTFFSRGSVFHMCGVMVHLRRRRLHQSKIALHIRRDNLHQSSRFLLKRNMLLLWCRCAWHWFGDDSGE